jgi:ferredoxin-type protein NapF
VFALVLLLLGPWVPERFFLLQLPAFSPFVALAALIAVRTAGAMALLALPVLLLALLIPRGFCRYVCPTGLLLELAGKLRGAGAAKPPGNFPVLNHWFALLTFGGAVVGYPLLLWLDPLALFSGFFGVWRWPLGGAALLAGLGLPLVVLLEWLRPNLWCARLCPLGATQELLAWPRQRAQNAAPPIAGRRAFLAAGTGAAGALLVGTVRGKAAAPLRPPGALDEDRFPGVCLRCGNCERVCPARIIRPDLGATGLASLLTPVLHFDTDYCRETCQRCTQVCPSGALRRLTGAEKLKHVLGSARIDLDSCLLAAGQECTECIKSCPFGALAVQSTDGGFSTQPVLDAQKCNGCGSCEANCPVRPRRAIRVVRA